MPYILFFFPLIALLVVGALCWAVNYVSDLLFEHTDLSIPNCDVVALALVFFLIGVTSSLVTWILSL